MSMPDGASSSTGGPNRALLVVGIAALVIAVAAIAFGAGRLTAPSEEVAAPDESTTTTTPIEVETVGETLAWSQSADIGEFWPVGLVEHDGRTYFFGSATVPYGQGTEEDAGLDAWRSDDGENWESLGTVIDAPALVYNVASTPRGLIATGRDAEDQPTVWVSPDGATWTVSTLPNPGTDLQTTDLSAAAANDAVIVVFGNSYSNPDQLILDAIGADFQSYGMSYGAPGGAFTLYGPLGIPVVSVTAEELGFTEEQLDQLYGDEGMQNATVWTSPDGANWTMSEIDADHVMSASTNEDGELVALGYGPRGLQAWTSIDGSEWVSQGTVGDVDQIVPWNDAFVGTRYTGAGSELAFSTDGRTWEPIGPNEQLPDELEWNFYPLAAGSAGIATVANGFDPFMEMGFEEPGPVVLERDGYTLTVDDMRGLLSVTDGDTELLRISLHSDRVPDEVAVDFAAETMTFLHPDTAEPLMTFTFDELEEAQQAQYAALEGDMGRQPQVFLFSRDATDWSLEDLAAVFDNGTVNLLHVMDDGVVAVVPEFDEAAIFGPPDVPYVRLWTGLVP